MAKILEEAASSPMARSLPIGAFVLAPIQRLARSAARKRASKAPRGTTGKRSDPLHRQVPIADQSGRGPNPSYRI